MTQETATALGLTTELLIDAGWKFCSECGLWLDGTCERHRR